MTLKNDENPPKTFVLPRNRFLATYNAMLSAKHVKEGETHLVELKTQDELTPPEKQKKGTMETWEKVRKVARDIAEGTESVGKSVMGGRR